MSRILKLISRNKKFVAVGLIFLTAELLLCIFVNNHTLWLLIVFVNLICLILLILDICTLKLLKLQLAPFSPRSKVRNVDYLIIGELCDPKAFLPNVSSSFVQIKVPGASEFALYQILRRTFSILHENGTVVLVMDKHNTESRKIRIFDTFFLHDVTMKELNLDKWTKIKKIILFIYPVSCLKMVFEIETHKYSRLNVYENNASSEFCNKRKLHCYLAE